MSGPKRTRQQVKIKYKNILLAEKAHISGTGGGPLTQDFTTAEELALELNKGKPVMEGIKGGTATDSGPARETGLFIQVSGNTLTLLEPLDYDPPREGTSAAVECTSTDDEKVSPDFRRFEDPDTLQPDKQPEFTNCKNVASRGQDQNDMDFEMEIKCKSLRKLDLEIQKLERELQADK